MITISNNPATDQPADTRRIRQEIAIVLVVTFGLSGMRAALRLLSDLMQPVPLNQQQTTLAEHQSDTSWIDLAMQLCSSAMLFSWGFLALYLLRESIFSRWRPKAILEGAGLAALIGIPGLVFYLSAVHFGFSKQVVPSTLDDAWWEIIVLLIWSAANAFSEEIVVVMWLITRLQQLRIPPWVALLLSAVLRGSYHLYQGWSAGLGNIIMGLIFGTYYLKTRRVWPLILGHFLIDAVAFVGYSLLRGHLSFLGL
ncbi:MAG: CPBP family intramembrane glutamic endopeptidase [Corynebacterium matruchotii]|uniref:CPBP family intramembrane glutamic endopeptidase n=1 Tax=Corynebacterium matruchotii TaxID=43768 RepID=UPI003617818F